MPRYTRLVSQMNIKPNPPPKDFTGFSAKYTYVDVSFGRLGIYRGDWLKGLPHGKGILIWIDGDRYDGEWKCGKRDGYGIFTGADGRFYEGKFQDDACFWDSTPPSLLESPRIQEETKCELPLKNADLEEYPLSPKFQNDKKGEAHMKRMESPLKNADLEEYPLSPKFQNDKKGEAHMKRMEQLNNQCSTGVRKSWMQKLGFK